MVILLALHQFKTIKTTFKLDIIIFIDSFVVGINDDASIVIIYSVGKDLLEFGWSLMNNKNNSGPNVKLCTTHC